MNDRTGQQPGSYRLLRLLGQGGFADTYLGEHIYLKTEAAIKVMRIQLASSDQESFFTEARTIARLRHPHIVRVLELGVEEHTSTPFLVMDYASNGTLRQRYSRGKSLPPREILPYVQQVASALQYAHDQRLVHRDVKPENMLLGDNNTLLLSDFGIAVVVQESTRLQTLQDIAGTGTYMAPEQIHGKPRAASDQYALGIVIYEWLTGTVPFTGSYAEVAIQHERMVPPPLHEKFPAISSNVEFVVMTALAKDPHRRFASIQAFARALEQAIQSPDMATEITPLPHPAISQAQMDAPTEAISHPTPIVPPVQLQPVYGVQQPQMGQFTPTSTPPGQQMPLMGQPVPTPARQQPPSSYMGQPPLSASQQLPQMGQSTPPRQPYPVGPQDPYTPPPFSLKPQPFQSGTMPVSPILQTAPITPPLSPSSGNQRQKRRPSLLFIVAMIAIVLLLIGGGGLVYAVIQPNQQHAQATTTAQTAVAMNTAHAIATVQGQAHATAIAQAQATAAVTATASALQHLYAQVTTGAPTINDPLSHADNYGWDDASYVDSTNKVIGSCGFTGGAYHDKASPGYFINCQASATNFSNLAYQVNMNIVSGNSGGLLIRSDSHGSGYYFRISTDGTYKIEKIAVASNGNANHTALFASQTSAVHPGSGQTNQLAVVARGNDLYFFVNQVYIDHVVDSTYTSGQIGVFADSDAGSVEAVFTSAELWKLS